MDMDAYSCMNRQTEDSSVTPVSNLHSSRTTHEALDSPILTVPLFRPPPVPCAWGETGQLDVLVELVGQTLQSGRCLTLKFEQNSLTQTGFFAKPVRKS